MHAQRARGRPVVAWCAAPHLAGRPRSSARRRSAPRPGSAPRGAQAALGAVSAGRAGHLLIAAQARPRPMRGLGAAQAQAGYFLVAAQGRPRPSEAGEAEDMLC